MERKRIYLCLAHMSEDGIEQKYIKEAFDTNWVVPLGPNVNGFDKDYFRKDACGAWIQRSEYGNHKSQYGWDIDHVCHLTRIS